MKLGFLLLGGALALLLDACYSSGHCNEDWSAEEHSCALSGGTWYCESAACVGGRPYAPPPPSSPHGITDAGKDSAVE